MARRQGFSILAANIAGRYTSFDFTTDNGNISGNSIRLRSDSGVASGEVHIMAGIYFSLQRKENSVDLAAVLTGYLRLGGSLSVLGLIKISVEFNLSFTYDSARDKAYGRATLTVHVDVALFNKSIELTVERAFGGSGDPKFGELFDTAAVWNEYALAFA